MSLLAQAKKLANEIERSRPMELPSLDDLDEVLGYDPRPAQAEMDRDARRFSSFVTHRRLGKTVRTIRKLVRKAMLCPFDDGRYAYLAPTYAMAEDIAWAYLTAFARRVYDFAGLVEREWINQSRLSVWLPTYDGGRSRVRLYGVDSPKQRMRGLYLDGAVFDEWAQIPFSVWSEQVRPMLADENRAGVDIEGQVNQWAEFITTPFGRNHAYTMHRKAETWFAGGTVVEKDPETNAETPVVRDDWAARVFKASETGILTRKELLDAYQDMGRSKYEQEFECSWDAAVEGAIYAREIEEARAQNRIRPLAWNKLVPVNTAWDLGWDDATAIWFFQHVGEQINVIDYYEASGADLSHYADILADKRYRYGYHLFPHDVAVHELGSGKSRESILRSLGIRVTVVPKHSPWDGISAAQAMFSQCVFDETRCADGLDRLALYRREMNEKLGVLRQNPVHDWTSHGADAWRTLAVGRRRTGNRNYDSSNMTAAQM